jgi:hypothetical protein
MIIRIENNQNNMQKTHRPTGVTIIAIFTIMVGVILSIAGVSLVAVGALISDSHFRATTAHSSSFYALSQVFSTFGMALGVILLSIGLTYVVLFYGLMKGTRWAWNITVILLIIGIAIQLISTISVVVFTASVNNGTDSSYSIFLGSAGAVIGIVANIVTIYYLYRPAVKFYFGKERSASSSSLL